MPYRLEELAKLASELGFHAQRTSGDRLEIELMPDCILAFCNLPEGDTLIGFSETPWHDHGTLMLECGQNRYSELDELDVLIGLGSGELVVVTRVLDGKVQDRWIAHKGAALELTYIEPGEELRVVRLPGPRARGAQR